MFQRHAADMTQLGSSRPDQTTSPTRAALCPIQGCIPVVLARDFEERVEATLPPAHTRPWTRLDCPAFASCEPPGAILFQRAFPRVPASSARSVRREDGRGYY